MRYGNANAFMGGLFQGIDAVNAIRRENRLEEETQIQRERQRQQDATEMQKTNAYLRGLEQSQTVQARDEARKQEAYEQLMTQKKIGEYSDQIKALLSSPDENVRKTGFENIGRSMSNDPLMIKAMNLNPAMGNGDGRIIVGFHNVNPSEKNPRKVMLTPLVFNEALQSVGPYTADNTARWPEQKGMVFTTDMLDRMAGRPQEELVAAMRPGDTTPTYIPRSEAGGLVPGSVWENEQQRQHAWGLARYREDAATKRAELLEGGRNARAGGKSSDLKNRFAAFRADFKNVTMGKFYPEERAIEIQQAAKKRGVLLRFNRTQDPDNPEATGYILWDYDDLNQIEASAGGSPVPVSPGLNNAPGPVTPTGQGTRPLMPGDKFNKGKPIPDGIYHDDADGKVYDYEGGKPVSVKSNGNWIKLNTAPATKPPASTRGVNPTPSSSPAVPSRNKRLSEREISRLASPLVDPVTQDPNATREWIRKKYGDDNLALVEQKAAEIKKKGLPSNSVRWTTSFGQNIGIDLNRGNQ
jgi:hypothetical protein